MQYCAFRAREEHKVTSEYWLDKTQTLLDSIDLIDPSSLPTSFSQDVLAPVLEGKNNLQKLAEKQLILDLITDISGFHHHGQDKPWYFWESLANRLANYCGAQSCQIFRQGAKHILFKIHPLQPEEDAEEIRWPEDSREPIVPFDTTDFKQAWLVRIGPSENHPLVLLLTLDKVTPRIKKDRMQRLKEHEHILINLCQSHFPNLNLTATMEIASDPKAANSQSPLLGRDPSFLASMEAARQASASDAPVYFRGESGTGKELFARYLHDNSVRAGGPFIPINCSAIPGELIESELFGHEKGAFTGAYYRKIGKAEQANGGTLFLDEIGEMPLPFQAKLLRFLQEKQFTRVGGNQSVSSDARIVVATHRDLKEMVADGRFREDLYFRVHVIPITISPLRERGGDIRFLAENFFHKYIGKSRMSRRRVDETIYDILESYPFPGNVRELDNIVQRTVVMTQKEVIAPEDLPDEVLSASQVEGDRRYQLHPYEKFDNLIPQDRDTLRWLKKEVEGVSFSYQRDLDRRFLLHLLKENNGSARKASESAGINRTLFYKLLKRAGLDISTLQKK